MMPIGIFGGHEGHAASTRVYRDGELIEDLPSKYSGYKMQAGDIIEFQTACGAGYGRPYERDPEQVLFPVMPSGASPDEQARFERAAQVARFFGGQPRAAAAAGGEPMPLPVQAAAPAVAAPTLPAGAGGGPKKKREGC